VDLLCACGAGREYSQNQHAREERADRAMGPGLGRQGSSVDDPGRFLRPRSERDANNAHASTSTGQAFDVGPRHGRARAVVRELHHQHAHARLGVERTELGRQLDHAPQPAEPRLPDHTHE